MTKNMSMKKVMDQLLFEENTAFKLEKLHLVLLKRISELQENAEKKAQEQYELFSNLNPRYNEEGLTPKTAQIKLDAINGRSNQGLIRPY